LIKQINKNLLIRQLLN